MRRFLLLFLSTLFFCHAPALATTPEYKFTATIDLSQYDDNYMGEVPITEFGFDLGAAGTFYVDWGDGTTETIEKDNTDAVTYTHDYGTASGTYTVKISGLATDYSDDEYRPAITFGIDVGAGSSYSEAITEISGSLGAIFPTLSDGSQPRFKDLFYQSRIPAIPSGLFDGIHGAPVSNMFNGAFYGCYNLTSIPENLFSGITGAATGMFEYTFSECRGLTSIPENLFSGVTGSAPYLFGNTFGYCSNLTDIPENLFAGITGAATGMFEYTFFYCSSLTGPSARINGKPLYELWPDNVAEWGADMYFDAYGLDDYACIPTDMGGGGETCEPTPEYKFSITTTSDASSFSFKISAAGTFYVDWGDGNTEKIEKSDTTDTQYSHTYSTAGAYTIRLGGLATAYNGGKNLAAINFVENPDIESINGSLGAIFPTLSDGSQPSFYYTFNACYFLTDIPENLFSGITGNAPYMFEGTFATCESLTSIPENLFSGITGAAEGMFRNTFMGCGDLTNIPENLFSGITGSAPDLFNGTFDTCMSLTSIPENLFSGITGVAEDMFYWTFIACTSLTGPSARINGKPLYELWPDNVAEWGADMYLDAFGLDDYACIPTDMGGGGETCEPAPEAPCAIGISQIKTSTGLSFSLYAEKYTEPSLVVGYNDGKCYGKLEVGNATGTMNFNYNGTVYHLIN